MKYIIRWNTGYGDNYDVVDAASIEEANIAAYDQWNEDSQSQCDCEAEEFTEEAWEDCQ